MKILFKRKDYLDFLILWILLLHVMFFRWIGLTSLFNKIALFLILLRLFQRLHATIKMGAVIEILLMLVVYPLLNFQWCGGQLSVLITNIYIVCIPMLVFYYITQLLIYKMDFFKLFLKSIFWPLNIFMLFNIPIILLQLAGVYQLAGVGFSSSNSFMIEDMISGTFGYNGTPMMTLFFLFFMMYSYFYYKNYLKYYKKLYILFYTIYIVFMCIISLYNDNKGFYLLMGMAIILAYVKENINKLQIVVSKTKLIYFIIKIMLFIVSFILVLLFFYKYTPIGISIDSIIHEITIGWEKNNLVQGSSERFGMISFILKDKSRIMKGYGIGNYSWTEEGAFGFNHYGQSDIGTFLCLGGILFIIIIAISLYCVLYKVFRNHFFTLCIIIYLCIVGIYTQLFTVTSLMVSTMFLCSIYCIENRKL